MCTGTHTSSLYLRSTFGCNPTWIYRGCFYDAGYFGASPRVIPVALTNQNSFTPVAQCEALALSQGYNSIGLQANGQCWAGVDSPYDMYGSVPGNSCGTLGGVLTNQVYTLGCVYTDTATATASMTS